MKLNRTLGLPFNCSRSINIGHAPQCDVLYPQEIRRHLMTKRPQFIPDNEEKLADAEESRGFHSPRAYHSPRAHASRHHRKHDKIVLTTADCAMSATTESFAKMDTTLDTERVSTEEKLERYSTTPVEASIAETTTEASATATPMLKPKKPPRRQKVKDSSTNRTEIEEDKPQRRRKIHHHRRNNTLLTNSVHDDGLRVTHANASDTSEAPSVSTQDPAIHDRHDHTERRFSSVSSIAITEMQPSTTRQGLADVFGTSDDFEDHTMNSITITESGTMTTQTSTQTTTEMSRINVAINKNASPDRSRGMTTLISSSTTPSTKRHSKVQKNRTAILKPARIDVTILEAPERRHKQGKSQIKNKSLQSIRMFKRFLSVFNL